MSEAREGGCACGEVRYRLTSEPLFTHCCHCLSCQRQTGSAFVINLLIEADRVELLSGEPLSRRLANGRLDELMAVAGINLLAIPVVLICAVFARGYVRGLSAAMLEGA